MFQWLKTFFATAKPITYALFFAQEINFILFFKCDYLILTQNKKNMLNGDFTISYKSSPTSYLKTDKHVKKLMKQHCSLRKLPINEINWKHQNDCFIKMKQSCSVKQLAQNLKTDSRVDESRKEEYVIIDIFKILKKHVP